MSKNYYDILGVDKNATKEDIKKAYRNLAKKYHPDNSHGDTDEEKFKEISDAYSILSDDTKKSNYDNFGTPDGQQGFGGFGGFGGFDMSDMFSEMFNGMGGFGFQQQQNIKRGNDIKLKVTIDITDVNNGLEKKLKYKREVKCKSCNGWGGDHEHCTHCNGTGKVTQQRRMGYQTIITTVNCPHCNGDGFTITKSCNVCNGTGVTREDSDLSINIPKGVNNGDQFQANGKGNAPIRAGNGGIYGNLFIFIEVVNNTELIREGYNLIFNAKLSFTKMILGCDFIIPSLEGNIKIKIDPHSKPTEIKRLKNKGLSDQRGQKGDLLVVLNLDIPKKLSKQEKELLQKLSECDNFK